MVMRIFFQLIVIVIRDQYSQMPEELFSVLRGIVLPWNANNRSQNQCHPSNPHRRRRDRRRHRWKRHHPHRHPWQ